MEQTTTLLYTISSVFLLLIAFKLFKRQNKKIPPSPARALPIIGHLLLVQNQPLHRVLHKFSQKCCPIFSLRLGNRLVVVVASPSLVEECFTKNDVVLANRPRNLLGKYIGYNWSNIVNANYGDHWRNLRKLDANEIFSPSRLHVFLSIRQDEVTRLLRGLYEESKGGFAVVEMQSKLQELTFNVIMRMCTGKRYFGEDESDAEAEEVSGAYSGCFSACGFKKILQISCHC